MPRSHHMNSTELNSSSEHAQTAGTFASHELEFANYAT